MFKFSKKTLELLHKAGWSEDRHSFPADKYIKALEDKDFYVSDAVKKFLSVFGGLLIRHPHAKLKEEIDYFHFDVIKAINSGDPTWVSEEYSSRVGKKLCIIGEAFRRIMVLCMSEDKKVYAGTDEALFFVGESPESAIEALCNGDDLKEISELNDFQLPEKILNLTKVKLPYLPNKKTYFKLHKESIEELLNIKNSFYPRQHKNITSNFRGAYA